MTTAAWVGITTDGGTSWTTPALPPLVVSIGDLSCGGDSCEALVEAARPLPASARGLVDRIDEPTVATSSDGGRSWTVVRPPVVG